MAPWMVWAVPAIWVRLLFFCSAIDCLIDFPNMPHKAGQEQRGEGAAGPGHDHIAGLFRGNGSFSNVVEQGQGGIELYFLLRQRGDRGRGGEGAQQALSQVLKLHTVWRVVNKKLLPVQDSKCFFYIQIKSPLPRL